MERLNDHHIIFHRNQHEGTKDNKFIRRNTGLIVAMPQDVHAEMHRNVPGVPPIDIYMARRVKAMMIKGRTATPLQAIDTYCWAIEEAMEHPNTYAVEQTVGLMAIEAVRMQIPYIKEGCPDERA